MPKSFLARRPYWVAGATALLLALSFSFAPVRTWAGEFLGLFRVQQIRVLPIDTAQLDKLANDPTLSDQISQLFAQTVNVTREPGTPVAVASAADASQQAGFAVRELAAAGAKPQWMVHAGPAFEVVIDRARAQALLDEAGRGDLLLPASIDGARIKVDVPVGVSAAYGTCPTNASEIAGEGMSPPEPGNLGDCVLLQQSPSPSVTTPPDLDMAQLAEIGLQLTGMTPAEAHAYSQSVDWTSTLVVPMPRNAAINTQVQVDGVTGNLLYREADDGVPQRYTVVWVKDGIIYALSGFGTPEDAVALANSIQ